MIDQRDDLPTSPPVGADDASNGEQSSSPAEPQRLRIWETVVLALFFLAVTLMGVCGSDILIRMEGR